MRPPDMAMSASYRSPPLPSAMLPPRITRSGVEVMAIHPGLKLCCGIIGDPALQSTAGIEVQECISLESETPDALCGLRSVTSASSTVRTLKGAEGPNTH